MDTAAGVDPKMVEWFGRWRFESVRAYTEDARAQAPQAAQIASLVMHPASPTPAHVTAGQAPRTRAGGGFGAPRTPRPYAQGAAPHEPAAQADFINLKRWVENKLAVADGETPCYLPRIASSKMHIALKRVLDAEPPAWTTLCGWQFGMAPAGAVKRLQTAAYAGASACINCKLTAARAGIAVDGVFGDAAATGSADYVSPSPASAASSGTSECSSCLDEGG
jgi:hypothetical protein